MTPLFIIPQQRMTTQAIVDLQRKIMEQAERIKRLETRAILNEDKEQRLQVVANAAVIREHSERVERLEAAIRIINRAWDTVVGHAERIECLETAILDFHDRIGKLEAALEAYLIVANWNDAATPPMNEMDGEKEP